MIQSFDYNAILVILSGVKATLILSAIAFCMGGFFGLLVALARTSGIKLLERLSSAYIDFFQGTPMLLQLFLAYYGLPVLGFPVNPWTAVTIGLTLHASAYLGEIWRGGIQAVPRGQTEAAAALGLSYRHRMRDIVLPQALRLSLAPTVGFSVQLIKGTSLAAIIGFVELSRSAQIIASTTYKPLLAYGAAGIFYFAICFPLSVYSMRLAKKYNRKT
ncbi:amino acid ABC transporter permease [Mesorhizobium sp. DCY119]|nr:amino acid ABC transporter permease [Mesorhizobium sp. DCY119]